MTGDPTESVPCGRLETLPHELTAITKSTADVGPSTVLSTETEISNKGPVILTCYTGPVRNAIPAVPQWPCQHGPVRNRQ